MNFRAARQRRLGRLRRASRWCRGSQEPEAVLRSHSEDRVPRKPRILTVWPFTEMVCGTRTSVMESSVSRTQLCHKSNDRLLNEFKQQTDPDPHL